MDAGEAVEFDHPNILLQNRKGYLSELVRKTGTGTAAFLKKTAKEVSMVFDCWAIFWLKCFRTTRPARKRGRSWSMTAQPSPQGPPRLV